MKFRKILVSASVVAAGSGLLATLLTSCSKANIDEDLKIKLDDNGRFLDPDTLSIQTKSFKEAAQNALKLSSTWKTFKEQLAKEIIFKWFENRAASDNHPKRNGDFKTFLSKHRFSIDESYNEKVDSYKSKYGANHQFYLQNEVLSSNGGTVDSYKHTQLLDAVKDEFISNAFRFNYFSMASETNGIDPSKYPHIFTETTETAGLTTETLNNPINWDRIGFYAKSNKSFITKPEDGVEALAAHPDGDYAIMQNYVFNRWFETEKPFFSAASLFKYNKPSTVGSAMSDFYSNKTSVPETPNEAFPFFGVAAPSQNGYVGQRAFWQWYKALNNGAFSKQGLYKVGGTTKFNQTVSIPRDYTEDSQTLLLCYASKMIAGSSNTLYTPYAISAASLYDQMLTQPSLQSTPINYLTKEYLTNNIIKTTDPEPLPDSEDPIILKMFFYNELPANGLNPTITSSLYLPSIYSTGDAIEYHCPLFKENKQFTFFYGDMSGATPEDRSGIKYVTNNVQINDLVPEQPLSADDHGQPWIFELNESGMHAQTIDGYQYVNSNLGSQEQYRNGRKALKKVLMYRLLQKQMNWDAGITSANVLGSNGDLLAYLKENFADIVLEMALSKDKEVNIFRDIDTYEKVSGVEDAKQFFIQICNEQKLSDNWANIKDYITKTQQVDLVKSAFTNIVNSDEKIYAYRSTQITNSKNDKGSNKIFDNGLLAPLVVKYDDARAGFDTTRHYSTTLKMLSHPLYFNVDGSDIDSPTCSKTNFNKQDVKDVIDQLGTSTFISGLRTVEPNTDNGFSAQINAAKNVQSNRFWYKSSIVDKIMYPFMDNNALVTEIKSATYEKYAQSFPGEKLSLSDIKQKAAKEITSVYKSKKVLTSENNFSNVSNKGDATTFYGDIDEAYKRLIEINEFNNGKYNENKLSESLFDATLVYLSKNNFEKFYSALNDTIKDGERAYVAYLTKYNTYDPFATIDKNSTSTLSNNPYLWEKNVANIYDDYHYAGNISTSASTSLKGDFNSYWNIIDKKFNDQSHTVSTLSGFLGIQTPSKNELDSDSGLNGAAFGTGSNPFSHSVFETKTVDTGEQQAENAGVWYPWAGKGVGREYDFSITAGEGRTEAITDEKFDAVGLSEAKKLAYKFAEITNAEDIRNQAGIIGKELHSQDNFFTKVASGQISYNDPKLAASQMKYDILYHLLNDKIDGTQTSAYKSAFKRLENVELRKGMYDSWCFEKQPNVGFKAMVTQINRADVDEKRMALQYDNTTKTWSMPSDAPITEEEFWYILCSFANDSNYQQDAMKDAIKVVFKGEKLIVYDAQLYNKFDSTWIKDWVRKPIGE